MKHIRRYHNRYAVTGDYTAIKVMIASVVFCWVINNLDWSQWIVKAEFVSPLGDAKVIQIDHQVEVKVPVPLNCKTEKCQIMAYIVERFGDDAADAITMINKCENHAFNPKATNTANSNGTIDRGIFQINSIHGGDEMYNWRTNIDAAYKIFKNRGWGAWSCSYVIGVKSFWQK